jgi:hypothetical protein
MISRATEHERLSSARDHPDSLAKRAPHHHGSILVQGRLPRAQTDHRLTLAPVGVAEVLAPRSPDTVLVLSASETARAMTFAMRTDAKARATPPRSVRRATPCAANATINAARPSTTPTIPSPDRVDFGLPPLPPLPYAHTSSNRTPRSRHARLGAGVGRRRPSVEITHTTRGKGNTPRRPALLGRARLAGERHPSVHRQP